jgi:hypothetical protein
MFRGRDKTEVCDTPDGTSACYQETKAGTQYGSERQFFPHAHRGLHRRDHSLNFTALHAGWL